MISGFVEGYRKTTERSGVIAVYFQRAGKVSRGLIGLFKLKLGIAEAMQRCQITGIPDKSLIVSDEGFAGFARAAQDVSHGKQRCGVVRVLLCGGCIETQRRRGVMSCPGALGNPHQ